MKETNALCAISAGCGRPDVGFTELLVVEPRLREQYEMPRPSDVLTAVLDSLPPVFVGSERQLATLVAWLAERLREAFDAAGMALPPWRGASALLARWQLLEEDMVAPPPLPPPGPARGAHASEELVLRQRNGAFFTAQISTCSPHRTPPRS